MGKNDRGRFTGTASPNGLAPKIYRELNHSGLVILAFHTITSPEFYLNDNIIRVIYGSIKKI